MKPKANGATCFFVLVGFAGLPFCATRTSPANGAMEPVTRKPQDQSDCEMSLVTDVANSSLVTRGRAVQLFRQESSAPRRSGDMVTSYHR